MRVLHVLLILEYNLCNKYSTRTQICRSPTSLHTTCTSVHDCTSLKCSYISYSSVHVPGHSWALALQQQKSCKGRLGYKTKLEQWSQKQNMCFLNCNFCMGLCNVSYIRTTLDHCLLKYLAEPFQCQPSFICYTWILTDHVIIQTWMVWWLSGIKVSEHVLNNLSYSPYLRNR